MAPVQHYPPDAQAGVAMGAAPSPFMPAMQPQGGSMVVQHSQTGRLGS